MELVVGASTMKSLLGKLGGLLAQEYALTRGVRGDVQYINDELASMQAFLRDLSANPDDQDNRMKDWMKQIRDIAYDMEDCVDDYAHRLPNDPTRDIQCCAFIVTRIYELWTWWPRRDIASKIADLKARAQQIAERRSRYGVHNPRKCKSNNSSAAAYDIAEHQLASRQLIRTKNPVGMDTDMKKLEDWVTKSDVKERAILSIVGFGGVGKTTIATALYRKFRNDFDCGATVTVSQNYDQDAVLRTILNQVRPQDSGQNKQDSITDTTEQKNIKLKRIKSRFPGYRRRCKDSSTRHATDKYGTESMELKNTTADISNIDQFGLPVPSCRLQDKDYNTESRQATDKYDITESLERDNKSNRRRRQRREQIKASQATDEDFGCFVSCRLRDKDCSTESRQATDKHDTAESLEQENKLDGRRRRRRTRRQIKLSQRRRHDSSECQATDEDFGPVVSSYRSQEQATDTDDIAESLERKNKLDGRPRRTKRQIKSSQRRRHVSSECQATDEDLGPLVSSYRPQEQATDTYDIAESLERDNMSNRRRRQRRGQIKSSQATDQDFGCFVSCRLRDKDCSTESRQATDKHDTAESLERENKLDGRRRRTQRRRRTRRQIKLSQRRRHDSSECQATDEDFGPVVSSYRSKERATDTDDIAESLEREIKLDGRRRRTQRRRRRRTRRQIKLSQRQRHDSSECQATDEDFGPVVSSYRSQERATDIDDIAESLERDDLTTDNKSNMVLFGPHVPSYRLCQNDNSTESSQAMEKCGSLEGQNVHIHIISDKDLFEPHVPKSSQTEDGNGDRSESSEATDEDGSSESNQATYRNGNIEIMEQKSLAAQNESNFHLTRHLPGYMHGQKDGSAESSQARDKDDMKERFENKSLVAYIKTKWKLAMPQIPFYRQEEKDSRSDVKQISNVETMNHDQLVDELKKRLATKRYLLFIDDIWSARTWESIRNSLPDDNGKGSKIIVTSRFQAVGSTCCQRNDADLLHTIDFLSGDEPKRLFDECVTGSRSSTGRQEVQSEVPEEVWKICGGLPLAIVTMAGLVACNASKSNHYWSKVCKSVFPEPMTFLTLNGVTRILDCCYNDLPADLKTCVLYLSIFPKGWRISRKRLMRRWVAEGFVSEKQGLTEEEVAETYFNQLLRRNIIRPLEHDSSGKVKSIQVHDMVLEYIVSKSSEENFITVVGGHLLVPAPSNKVRRLSMQSSGSKHGNSTKGMSLSQVRSLTVFGSLNILPFHSFNNGIIQVLDLEGWNGLKEKHLKDVCKMLVLKYLSLRRTGIHKIPSKIKKLEYLETLDIRETNVGVLPKTVSQLKRISSILGGNKAPPKGLRLPQEKGKEPMKSKEALTVLRVLSGIEIVEESTAAVANLHQLTGLRKLAIYKLNIAEDGETFRELRSAIEYLCSCGLKSLAINDEQSSFINSLDTMSAPPRYLVALRLSGKLGSPPKWLANLNGLNKLTLSVTVLRTDTFELLQSLPLLFSLTFSLSALSKLECDGEIVDILENNKSETDGEIFVPVGGFQGLKLLRFFAPLVPKLSFPEDAMPELERIEMQFEAFEGLSGIDTLKKLQEVHLRVNAAPGDEITKFIVEDLKKTEKPKVVVDCANH